MTEDANNPIYYGCLDSNTSGKISNGHTLGSVYTSWARIGAECAGSHDNYEAWILTSL